jgi:hydroxyacylglutathione hydrolase
MPGIVAFECNPFQENTYLITDKTGLCAIVDPGCYTREEQASVQDYISKNNLKPALLLNTHCHIDHVLGNYFIHDTYQLPLHMHRGELPVLHAVETYAESMGIRYKASPEPEVFLEPGDVVTLGDTKLRVLFTPGHSPASICFYNQADGYLIGGDVLFLDSIGRYDLPGGNLDTLLQSIREQLFTLPDETIVYPGHGPHTTIGREKKYNPFLRS